MNSAQTVYKHGKLLISGEYAVLDGALALALPTIVGQRFEFSPIEQSIIFWEAIDHKGQIWFTHRFDLEQLTPNLEGDKTARILGDLFAAIKQLNPKAFTHGWSIKASLEFDRNWGLGSSSTLVSALADFFSVDAFALLAASFGGSGYDIACADAKGPILYRKTSSGPEVQHITFNPSFSEELFLVYLNQKMNSREAIKQYTARPKSPQLIGQISTLTKDLVAADRLESFEKVLSAHEQIIGTHLAVQPISETLFQGCTGVFSSLGAWGGDFALFSRKENIPSLKEKGYSTILGLSELCVLS